ncbi:MAG TPA: hypothetical protein VM925_30595 [Labilithrix sp.]|nr:hypothetical protein [Labilithrix sp.]
MRRLLLLVWISFGWIDGCGPAASPPSATPAPKATTRVTNPEVAWSEDGQFISWRSTDSEHVFVARSKDLVPLRTLKTFQPAFAGNWLALADENGVRIERPEDGSLVATTKGHDQPLLVTRSSLAEIEENRVRLISRATGAERSVAAKLCPPRTELRGLTPAAIAGDKIALDVECASIGADPCTGARGNCESRAESTALFDGMNGTFTELGASFWAQVDVVSFSPDGETIAIVGQAHTDTLFFFDARTGRVRRSLKPARANESLGYYGCGTWAYNSETFYLVASSGVYAFAARTGARTAFTAAGEGSKVRIPTPCTVRLVGDRLVVSAAPSVVIRLRVPNLDAADEHETKSSGGEMLLSPDGHWVAVRDDAHALVDAKTWQTIAPLPKTGSAVFDPTSTFLAVGRTVFQAESGQAIGTLQ